MCLGGVGWCWVVLSRVCLCVFSRVCWVVFSGVCVCLGVLGVLSVFGCVWVCLGVLSVFGCVWVCLVECVGCVWVCLVECVGWCLGVFGCVECVE